MELAVTVTAVGASRGFLIVNKQAPHDTVSVAPNTKSQPPVITNYYGSLGITPWRWQTAVSNTNNYELIFIFMHGVLERQSTEHQGCQHATTNARS